MKKLFFKGRFIFIPLAAAAFLALISFVVMELWNNLLPGILHVGMITFWQAMGVFILCKILFGFGRGGRGGAPWMRYKMEERFKNMSPEEKERFKQKMQQRFGGKCGFGNRHPFEAEWDNNAAEAASPTE
ncbi:MAG: hypothetical protein JWR67_946 [Mucilaginibacter sp.]|nr:hypothetical protein [Mucilaginibacter sp.]